MDPNNPSRKLLQLKNTFRKVDGYISTHKTTSPLKYTGQMN